MALFQELSYENAITEVKSVRFTLLSPEEIKRRSVVEVLSTDTFIGNDPVPNGLFDQRMGVVDNTHRCFTCHEGYAFCPGHIGHIELQTPMFHVHFFPYVIRVLKCVCLSCSKLLIDSEDPALTDNIKIGMKKRHEDTFSRITKSTCLKRCGQCNPHGCGAAVPLSIAKDPEKFLKIIVSFEDKKISLGASDVLEIFRRISDRDSDILGFNHVYSRPEWMLCTVLPVCPPPVRPSSKNEMGQRSEDDITTVLCNIVKNNNILKQRKAQGKEIDGNDSQLLQNWIACMVDNSVPNSHPVIQRTGRTITSLTTRLKAKEGRVRGNLLGKRVDFSARTVITPDPDISIDELGVPVKIAMNITYPEMVTAYNREHLQCLVAIGPNEYPGARFVQRAKSKRMIGLRPNNAIVVAEGDTVLRHMLDGDYVLFNRQPSLHKMSMMSHRVRVMLHDTFRLNACVTPSYNADFDGDEMNLHAPISAFTMHEIALLAAVPTQVISPKDSKPIISIVQDIALGVHQITHPEVRINRKEYYSLVLALPQFSGTMDPPDNEDGTYTGRQALSHVLPKNMDFTKMNDKIKSEENRASDKSIVIKNGKILSGVFEKGTYQSQSSGIVHHVYNELGSKATTDLFDGTQRLICDWLLKEGFSVGMSDLMIDAAKAKLIEEAADKRKREVDEKIKEMHMSGYNHIGLGTPGGDFETELYSGINTGASQDIERIITPKDAPPDNRIMRMIQSGSKGKVLNYMQMVAALGQVTVEGKRPVYGYDSRTLPHYSKYDDSAEARGFVSNSFVTGLTPQEFLFHSMGGREGLIDTAVRTSESGYISRKLVKALEDCKIQHDHTVRNSGGYIVQLLYGEDGMDNTSIESQKLFHLGWTSDQMVNAFRMSLSDPHPSLFTAEARSEWLKDPQLERMDAHFRDVWDDRIWVVMTAFKGVRTAETVLFPVHLHRIITGCMVDQRRHVPEGHPSDLDPRKVLDRLDGMTRMLRVTSLAEQTPVFRVLLRIYLSPKRLVMSGMMQRTFDRVASIVEYRYHQSVAHPGEMVGIVAAQSIGEPTLQLTLNTFHQAGVGSASQVVQGLPRVQELLNVTRTKNLKTVQLIARLPREHRYNKDHVFKLKNVLKTTRLVQVVDESRIYYDPDDFETSIAEDREIVKAFRVFKCDHEDLNPWIIRLSLNRESMLDGDITMYDISEALTKFYGKNIRCIYSDDNEENVVFRIRLEPSASNKNDMLTEVRAFEAAMMENVILKGGDLGIQHAIPNRRYMNKEQKMDVDTGMFIPYSEEDEWELVTDGTNLQEILAHPLVDSTCTITNDVYETYRVLGIEAARAVLLLELEKTMQSLELNPRHFLLLADAMTSRGFLQSIDRHGIQRTDIGPFARCSFEQTTDQLRDAGIFGETDRMHGVSGNVMLGQPPPGGTGSTTVIVDYEMLPKAVVEHPLPSDDNAMMFDDKFSGAALTFSFTIPLVEPGSIPLFKIPPLKIV